MGNATEMIKTKFQEYLLGRHDQCGDETVIIKPEGLLNIARFLKTDPELDFNVLMDITAVDYLGSSPRFEVVYHFYSMRRKARLRLKVPVPESHPEVDTLTVYWKGADWYEREVWDMFGIHFKGHPNLQRILMYDEFEGHPLRKDYPIKKRQPLIGPMN